MGNIDKYLNRFGKRILKVRNQILRYTFFFAIITSI